MIDSVAFKPDLPETLARFEAWWDGRLIDRPPVTLNVKPQGKYTGPTSNHASLRERWFDAEFNLERFIASMQQRCFLGDSLPVFFPNVGPELTSTLLGADLEYGETTSWSKPIIHSPTDWEALLQRQGDFRNEYWLKIEEMTRLAIERADGRYLVGMSDLHGNYDLLAGLREPQDLCLDLIDCPELVDRAAELAVSVYRESVERNYTLISEAGYGSTTWLPYYTAAKAYVPSCDFWCMISDEMAREKVLPFLHREMEPLERSIFHLDGPGALRHLPLLLEMDDLDAVQWCYGDGAGPSIKYLDTYRKILQAGKSIQLFASIDESIEIMKEIGKEGVWVLLGESFENEAEAQNYLNTVEKL
jgi:hypothetical protein